MYLSGKLPLQVRPGRTSSKLRLVLRPRLRAAYSLYVLPVSSPAGMRLRIVGETRREVGECRGVFSFKLKLQVPFFVFRVLGQR